jgi:hypothetical protein
MLTTNALNRSTVIPEIELALHRFHLQHRVNPNNFVPKIA